MRHPQTTWNQAERYQGRLNTPLSSTGERQLQLTVDAFRGQALDCVITSPLTRAFLLAHAIAGATDAPLRIDARLTEIAQGKWEGLHAAEIRQRYPGLWSEWHTRPDLMRFPKGETLIEVETRCTAALRSIFETFPRGTVAVVSHSVVVQILAAESLHIDLRFLHNIKVSNAGITTICGGQAPGRLISLNVTQAVHGSVVDCASAEGCANNTQGRQAI